MTGPLETNVDKIAQDVFKCLPANVEYGVAFKALVMAFAEQTASNNRQLNKFFEDTDIKISSNPFRQGNLKNDV